MKVFVPVVLLMAVFDRIEIVKGPRSTIYGTDAIGGVVNLISRTDGFSGADVMLDYGRYGTGEFAADGNYNAGGTSAQAALAGQRSAGFPTYAADTLDSGYKNLSGTAAIATHSGVWSWVRATTRRPARRSTPRRCTTRISRPSSPSLP